MNSQRISNIVRCRDGFSLAEIMVTALIFSFIVAISYAMLIAGSDSWEVNSTRTELQQELRKAMDWITQDLRQAGSRSITDVPANGNTYTRITFRKAASVSGGNIVWDASATRYSLGGTNGNQLRRQVGAQTPSIIAQNIQSLQFSRQGNTAGIVDVSLTAQKTTLRGRYVPGKIPIQVNMSLKIYLRN